MAPKRPNPPPKMPSSSPASSEEEESQQASEEEEESQETSSGEEEVESESEVEHEKPKGKIPQTQPSSEIANKSTVQKKSILLPPAESSSEEEEEASEEESEEEEDGEKQELDDSTDGPGSPTASDFTIKPITPIKPTSKDSKRPLEAQKDEGKEPKKAKTGEEEAKKERGSVGRVWVVEDEIAVLEGMIDYQKLNGAFPSADMAAFTEFMKGKLRAGLTKTQIYEKVRRMKKKFLDNVKKGENGKDLVFSKPHESKAFDLSKKIWGGGSQSNGVDDNARAKSTNGNAKKGGKVVILAVGAKEDEKKTVVKDDGLGDYEGDFSSKYPNLSGAFAGESSFLKDKLRLIGNVKASELEEKWKKLRQEEAEFFLKRLSLMTEQTKLVLDAMKNQ